LIIIHALGVMIAGIAALVEIESILLSWPLLDALSLIIAFLAYRRNRVVCLYYAITAPTVSVFCFAAIFGLNWGPERAHFPISFFLLLFGLGNCAFSDSSLSELKRPEIVFARRGPFQFSIAAIMGLTLLVGLSFSLWKTVGDRGIAISVILCYLSFLIYFLQRFHRRRKKVESD
jgi:hypothetical protein